MARGPAPTPTKLLKVRGSWRAKTRENEPELPVKAPPAPAFLNAEAKREWARQVKHLQTMGVIAEADRALLAFYCQAWAEFLEVNADLKKEGLTFSTETGYILPHPLVAIRNGAFERAKKIAAQFGFSPAARARLKGGAAKEDKPDGKARFFEAG